MSTPPPPPKPSIRPPGPPTPRKPEAVQPVSETRAEAIFNGAVALPESAWEEFLAVECRGDEALLGRVQVLLAAHSDASEFLDEPQITPELEAELARLKPEEEGETIGPYKLREQIGEGGFGTVWVADQERPVRRRVALKIIKLGMDTKEVIGRFEQERQALAMMDHPNIAKVLDAGATQYGRPFFVMELVRGMKITEYCDEQKLSTQERIELFITVCQAVQHAHQKGIIHRDLKPSNILVTINDGKAVPKVIDFGVAKATQGRLTDQTVYTQFQQMIGTPLYMSPEQAELTSLDIDTRSDIYALGVLLYELLTGHTPIEQDTLARLGMDEIRRIIREVDPPRPSLRMKTLDGAEMTTAAKRRNTEPAKLSGALRGDLDWIVMKCIEKDRARRYDTANGLAMDLQRHLANEVVVARPPTTAYLLSKLIKRNKSAVLAGCTVVLALIVGFAVAVWQAKRAEHEATRAQAETTRAKAAEDRATAALEELRATAPAFASQARALAAKEEFAEAIEKLDYAIKLCPDVAEYLVAKGDLLQCQLKLAEAAAIYREALRVKPGLARAEVSAKLCDELLAAEPGEQGKLTRESLAKLHLAMQQQQRPASHLMPIARLLGEEKKLIVDYWLARLKDLPILPEKPLKDRLTVREDGLLALDLGGTKIADLSPLIGMPLGTLSLSGCTDVKNFAPLHELRSLTSLSLSSTGIGDLSPLKGLPLEDLDLTGTKVFDLTALLGMKLKGLSLFHTRVSDLSPLAGMPLTTFRAAALPATDYSPLAGAPLEVCHIQQSPLRDLSFLRDSPVKTLILPACPEARGYSVLSTLRSLDMLILPTEYRSLPDNELAAIDALHAHPALRNIDAGDTRSGTWWLNSAQSKDDFWKAWDREESFVSVLRKNGFKFSFRKLTDGTYSLAILNQPLSDLSILKGMPISDLNLGATAVSDLTPLQGMPLKLLRLYTTRVTDLSPLKSVSLEWLDLSHTKVTDLSALRGMPLADLFLHGCNGLTDLSPLAESKELLALTLPPNAKDFEFLRTFPKLTRVGFDNGDANGGYGFRKTAAEFWKDYDGNKWLRALRESDHAIKELKQAPDGTWQVGLGKSKISDLAFLNGAPISDLRIHETLVTDLTPLHGMPLKRLFIYSTKVTDLSPLRGMPLSDLSASGTPVTDLSALAGMPLTTLRLHDCGALTDVSPLAACKELNNVTLPRNATNIESLRALPKLERISFNADAKNSYGPDKTAEEFWKEYDAEKK